MAAFASFGQGVEEQLAGYSAHMAQTLAGTLAAPVATALTAWFTWRAWTILFGGRSGSLAELLLDAARAALVAGFALSAPRFVSVVIPAITGCEAWLLQALPSAPASAWDAVDRLWEVTAEGVAALWALLGSYGPTRLGEAILLAVAVIVMSLLGVILASAAVGVILLARIALTLTLGFGPLFVCALMFPGGRGWFEPWLRSAVNYTLELVLAASVLLFFSGLFERSVAGITAAAAADTGNAFVLWIRLGITLVISLTAATVMRLVPAMAGGMVGGASMTAAGIGHMASGFWRPARSAAGGFLAGAGSAAGSSALTRAGRSLMGPAGLSAGGALASSAAGYAAGAAARVSAAAARRIARAVRAR